MSDDILSGTMPMRRITVRLSKTLGAVLRDRSRATGQTISEVVRVALENYLGVRRSPRSAYELAAQAGLIGCVRLARKT